MYDIEDFIFLNLHHIFDITLGWPVL